jgi:hypothetical protein
MGLFGLADLSFPSEASGKSSENVEPSRVAPTRSATDTSRESTSMTTPQSPDYKKKVKSAPPPKKDRSPVLQKKRPPTKDKTRPDKPRKEKPPIVRPPKRRQPTPQPGNSVIIQPPMIRPLPMPAPVYTDLDAVYYETDVYVEDQVSETDVGHVEAYNMLFTTASIALNGVLVNAGETNEFAAVVGMLFGCTSLALASSGEADYPLLDFLLGTASVGLGLWNLFGGIQRVDSTYEEVDYYSSDASTFESNLQSVSYSFSF